MVKCITCSNNARLNSMFCGRCAYEDAVAKVKSDACDAVGAALENIPAGPVRDAFEALLNALRESGTHDSYF